MFHTILQVGALCSLVSLNYKSNINRNGGFKICISYTVIIIMRRSWRRTRAAALTWVETPYWNINSVLSSFYCICLSLLCFESSTHWSQSDPCGRAKYKKKLPLTSLQTRNKNVGQGITIC